jgi:hypothetical protein
MPIKATTATPPIHMPTISPWLMVVPELALDWVGAAALGEVAPIGVVELVVVVLDIAGAADDVAVVKVVGVGVAKAIVPAVPVGIANVKTKVACVSAAALEMPAHMP